MKRPPLQYACQVSPPKRKGVFHLMPLPRYISSTQYKSERSLHLLAKAIAYSLCYQPCERNVRVWEVVMKSSPTPVNGWDDICVLHTDLNRLNLVGVNFRGTINGYPKLKEQVLLELSLIHNRPGYVYNLINYLYPP